MFIRYGIEGSSIKIIYEIFCWFQKSSKSSVSWNFSYHKRKANSKWYKVKGDY